MGFSLFRVSGWRFRVQGLGVRAHLQGVVGFVGKGGEEESAREGERERGRERERETPGYEPIRETHTVRAEEGGGLPAAQRLASGLL